MRPLISVEQSLTVSFGAGESAIKQYKKEHGYPPTSLKLLAPYGLKKPVHPFKVIGGSAYVYLAYPSGPWAVIVRYGDGISCWRLLTCSSESRYPRGSKLLGDWAVCHDD